MIGLQKHEAFNCNERSNEINWCKEFSVWWHQTISPKDISLYNRCDLSSWKNRFTAFGSTLFVAQDLPRASDSSHISALLLYAIAGKTIPSLFHLYWTIKSNIYYKSKSGNWLASVFNFRISEATSRRWNSIRGQKYPALEENSLYPTLKYELNSPFIWVIY